jgi:hypothetical protein
MRALFGGFHRILSHARVPQTQKNHCPLPILYGRCIGNATPVISRVHIRIETES